VFEGVMQPPDPTNASFAKLYVSTSVRPDYGAGVVFLQSLPSSFNLDSSFIMVERLMRFLIYDSRFVLAEKIADHLLNQSSLDDRMLMVVLKVYTILNDVSASVSVFERLKYRLQNEKTYFWMIDMYIRVNQPRKAYDISMEYRRVFSKRPSLRMEISVMNGYVRGMSMKECWTVIKEFKARFELYIILYTRFNEMSSRTGDMKRFFRMLKDDTGDGFNAMLYYHAKREQWDKVEKVYLEMVLRGVGVREELRGIVARVEGRGGSGISFSREEREMSERMGRGVDGVGE
jgi:pentatricopeptide repeat protein